MMSFALPSPGHQLTMPGGGGTHTCAHTGAANTTISNRSSRNGRFLRLLARWILLLWFAQPRSASFTIALVRFMAPCLFLRVLCHFHVLVFRESIIQR